MDTVLITGADRGVGYALCEEFVAHGWKVLAGQFMPEWKQLEELKKKEPDKLEIISLDVGKDESVKKAAEMAGCLVDHLDVLVNCAGSGGQEDGRKVMRAVFGVNTLGPMRMVEAFLPLMKTGKKRLCFVSSEAGSISVAHREGCSMYCLSKTSLNMAVRLMFNQLNPEGYSFRLYHPGWVRSYMMGTKSTVGNFEPEETAAVAFRQFTSSRNWEDTLVMTDVSDHAWPF